MVHSASHLAVTTAARGNYTTNQYRKACSHDIAELEAWSMTRFKKKLTECRVCMKRLSGMSEVVGTHPATPPAPAGSVVQPSPPPHQTHSRDEIPLKITRPAAIVRQGQLKLYATSLPVRELRRPGFYAIEKLDPDGAGPGYQRLLNEGRAKRLAEYLVDGHDEGDAFLPTSIFLATDRDVEFDQATNTISFDIHEVGPFNVVDGQHRIAGLVRAAEKNAELLDFEVPVNIAVNLDDISQMCHFLIVNTTQRSVDKAIEQQIVARLTHMAGLEKTPTIPRWIRRQVERGEDARAIDIAKYLNSEPSSAWLGKIRMANDESDGGTINQKSFINSLKKYVFSANNPLSNSSFDGNRPKILLNYWKAVIELLVDDPEVSTVVYKTTGVDLFHIVSATVFTHLAAKRDFTKDAVKTLLMHGFKNLPDENVAMSHPEWWYRGNVASGVNSAAVRKLANALSDAINAPQDAMEVAL
jgi:DGQHR domain-containing protein